MNMHGLRGAACLVLIFAGMSGPADVAFAEGKGSVVKVSGKVQINGQPAKVGMEVGKGDQLETENSDKSFVDVKFRQGHTLRIKNGDLSLASISDQFLLNMNKGSLYIHAGKLSGRQTFKVSTPTAVAGIRGTKFMMSASAEESYLCVCQGAVWAEKKGILNQLFGKKAVVKAGSDLHIRPGEKLSNPVESPMMVDMTWKEFQDMGFQGPGK